MLPHRGAPHVRKQFMLTFPERLYPNTLHFYKRLHVANKVTGKWLHGDFSAAYPALLTASPALAERLRWLLEINCYTTLVIKSARD